MDMFTMVILACVAGEPTCTAVRLSQMDFTNADACEARIDAVTAAMTRDFAQRPGFRGRQVTYDVSCMNREQLKRKLGVSVADL